MSFQKLSNASTNAPTCSVFGKCGGCQYQDLPYPEELKQKENSLKELLSAQFELPECVWEKIVPSPSIYHYRSRMDIKMVRTPDGRVLFGFSPEGRNQIVASTFCAIAMKPIANFLPELKDQALKRFTEKYLMGNLVVRTGDAGRVCWGGLGKRSLHLPPEDYFWTEIEGKKIFYSLDTFFQANLLILPLLMRRIRDLKILSPEVVFLDLYGGVGLFGIFFAKEVKKVVLLEDNIYATELAGYNARYHHLENITIMTGKLEDVISSILTPGEDKGAVAIVDPPRAGLDPRVAERLAQNSGLESLLYLSCNPQSLVRDLKIICSKEWQIEKIMPFDFFPRTRHVETLVFLRSRHNI